MSVNKNNEIKKNLTSDETLLASIYLSIYLLYGFICLFFCLAIQQYFYVLYQCIKY